MSTRQSTFVRALNLKMMCCAFVLVLFGSYLQAQTLVWEDNFNGTSLNPATWSYDFGDGCNRGICGWGNSELEYYTSRPENVSVANGMLVIQGRREAFGGREFTSGRIKTEGRVHFKYGTLEARIKVPNLQNGLWPAFWLLGDAGSWPMNGEIDIMEMGHVNAISAGVVNRRVGGACHWDNNGYAFAGSHTDFPVNLNNDFHIYKLVWDPTTVTCYVDNAVAFTMNITGADKTEFHIPHFMILNLAIGGTYTGILSPSGITAPLPARMEIDYVRLYQNSGNGSTLHLGANNAITGTYGVFTETTPVTGHVTYGQDANLYLWNGLASAGGAAFEGSQVMSYNTTAGQWWGLGVATSYKNLSAFQSTGQLRFHMRTSSTDPIGIGISTGHGDSWVELVNGGNQYGLVRNNTWCQVSIPFSAFPDLDLGSVKQIFMMRGGAPGAAYNFAVDNIYYSGGGTSNTPPQVSITSPANNATFTAPANITINANASDPGGSVTSVAFYNGSTLLGTDNTSPYSFAWNNVAAGSYSLTARATDNGGLTTTSAAVNITVGAAQPSQPIPGTIQAESYIAMSGVQTEATGDTGGGQNVGWIETGDWMDYRVNVASAGSYTVGFRVASVPGAAQVQLRSGTTVLASANIAATGGWQNWTTVNATATLSAGVQTLRVHASAGGFNINWISFTANQSSLNLALNKPTVTSSTESGAFPGSSAVDGNIGTRWSSAASDPQWIYVDLGANYNVTRVKVTWETARASNYQIQRATSASGPWTTMRTITGNTTSVNDNTGLSGVGRYIRIYGTARATQWGYSIWELEVYGTASARMATEEIAYEDATDSEVQFYPNPATNVLHVKGLNNGDPVSMITVTGQVFDKKVNNESISIEEIPSGVLVVHYQYKGRGVWKKIMKK